MEPCVALVPQDQGPMAGTCTVVVFEKVVVLATMAMVCVRWWSSVGSEKDIDNLCERMTMTSDVVWSWRSQTGLGWRDRW